MAEAEEKLEVEGCGFLCVHEKVVEKVQHELPQEETLLRLADLFKVFGDGTRVRILFVLLTAEVCVRPREAAGHDTIRCIAPIACAETGTAD